MGVTLPRSAPIILIMVISSRYFRNAGHKLRPHPAAPLTGARPKRSLNFSISGAGGMPLEPPFPKPLSPMGALQVFTRPHRVSPSLPSIFAPFSALARSGAGVGAPSPPCKSARGAPPPALGLFSALGAVCLSVAIGLAAARHGAAGEWPRALRALGAVKTALSRVFVLHTQYLIQNSCRIFP